MHAIGKTDAAIDTVPADSGWPLQQADKLEGWEDVCRSGHAETRLSRGAEGDQEKAIDASTKEVRPPCGPCKIGSLFQMFGVVPCCKRMPGSYHMSSLSSARTSTSFMPSSEGAEIKPTRPGDV